MVSPSRGEGGRDEILDVAERLFVARGYEHTTIDDVLDAAGVAEGSRDDCFKSKEDILDGIIARQCDQFIAAAAAVSAEDTGALEKILRFIFSLQPQGEHQKGLVRDLEQSSGGRLFLETLNAIVLRAAPILADIIKQGMAEGVFLTPFPLESAQILMAAGHALFDNADFSWTPDEELAKMAAFLMVIERSLGAKEGSLMELSGMWGATDTDQSDTTDAI